MCVPNWFNVEIDEVDLGRGELVGAALCVVGRVVVDGAHLHFDVPTLETVELGIGVPDGGFDAGRVVGEQVVGVDHTELERPEIGTSVTARRDLAGRAGAVVAPGRGGGVVRCRLLGRRGGGALGAFGGAGCSRRGRSGLAPGRFRRGIRGTVVVVIAARGGDERECQHGYEHSAECASPHIIPLSSFSRSTRRRRAQGLPPRCAQGKQTGHRLSRIHHDECCAMIGTARRTRA